VAECEEEMARMCEGYQQIFDEMMRKYETVLKAKFEELRTMSQHVLSARSRLTSSARIVP
jgi:hypothetical protein